MISDDGYILRSISRHGHIGINLHPASVSTILKALQKDLKMYSNEQPLSGHSVRVGAALDLLEQGESLERIMLRGGWQTDSTAMSYLRNWIAKVRAIRPSTVSQYNSVPPLTLPVVRANP